VKRFLVRLVLYVSMVGLVLGGAGGYGYYRSEQDFALTRYDKPFPALQGVKAPEYDPAKPTVAIVLGPKVTEVLDFLQPYDLFSRTEAYNVYAVASDRQIRSLAGGVELVPQYSFDELDTLLGKSPDIIVIPNIVTAFDNKGYDLVLQWIQKHAETTLLSICAGARNLADTGLLKGKSAASHWKLYPEFEEKYPDTHWIKDQRYVVDGNIISSAGLSSGIDAILYVISQKLGEPMAARVAREIHYPTYHFVQNPKIEDQFERDLRFYATAEMNHAFHWNKKEVGVLLYNGMDELALASIFDTYSDTGTTKLLTISGAKPGEAIITKHGLSLFARNQIADAPKLDKVIVPGAEARSLAAEDVALWNQSGRENELLFMHSDAPDRFVFDAPLEDLAKQEDVQTADQAAMRLEYRADTLKLEGSPFPWHTYGNLLVTALGALLIAFIINRRLNTKKSASNPISVHPG
jgi:AraC family transcriptional activator FtrA